MRGDRLQVAGTRRADDLSIVDDRSPIVASLPAEPVWVHSDPDRLRQIVDNLLANVRAHTPADAEARIRLTARAGTGPPVSLNR